MVELAQHKQSSGSHFQYCKQTTANSKKTTHNQNLNLEKHVDQLLYSDSREVTCLRCSLVRKPLWPRYLLRGGQIRQPRLRRCLVMAVLTPSCMGFVHVLNFFFFFKPIISYCVWLDLKATDVWEVSLSLISLQGVRETDSQMLRDQRKRRPA